jgi:hypothetical protein
MDEFRFSLGPIEELHTLGILWRRLEQGSETSFFVSWSWIGTWLKCLPENIRPELLRVTRGVETVAAAIAVKRQENRRGFLKVRQAVLNGTGDPEFYCITIEHNGFVGVSDQSLWPALLHWFAQGGADADELLLPGAGDGAVIAAPPGQIVAQGANGPWASMHPYRVVAGEPIEPKSASAVEPTFSRLCRFGQFASRASVVH